MLPNQRSPWQEVCRQPLQLGIMPQIRARRLRDEDWNFDYNLEVVQLAESIGFDIAMSAAQWAHTPGMESGNSLDSYIAPMAMAAATNRIMLISTLHILYGNLHPMHLAKFGATMDHITKGRWGINHVTGYQLAEFSMFGMDRPEHDHRFDLAGEMIEAIKGLWYAKEEGYTQESAYGRWKVDNAWISPKPIYDRPLLISAGGSPAAIDFFAKHSDVFFTTAPSAKHIDANLRALPDHVANIKSKKPDGKVWINLMMASCDTMEDTVTYIEEHNSRTFSAPPASFSTEPKKQHTLNSDSQSWLARGEDMQNYPPPKLHGGNCEMYGPPELMVEYLSKLRATGVDGVMLKFLDSKRDLEYFGERIMPLLIQEGLRYA